MKRATTSASNLARRALCPGSARMEEGLSDTDSEYSTEGTMLHSLFFSKEDRSHLTPDQLDALKSAEFHAEEFIHQVRQQHGIPEDAESVTEKEVELAFQDIPGHADFIITWPDHSVRVIIDAKFGFCDVDAAPDNLQLAAYALMAYYRQRVLYTAVAIVQPRNFGPHITSAIYAEECMVAIALEVTGILDGTRVEAAELNAGEKQCQFCKGKAICQAYKAKFMELETRPVFAIQTVDNATLERLKTACQFADKIKSEVNAELRLRISEDRMPGWKLRNGGDDREVTDPIGMFAAFRDYFGPMFSALDYQQCTDISWGKLAEMVGQYTALPKSKCEQIVKDLSEPFVVRTPREKSAVRESK